MHDNTTSAEETSANVNMATPSIALAKTETTHVPDTKAQDALSPKKEDEPLVWYVLRDLKRHNAKKPGHVYLSENDVEVFLPTRWERVIVKGKSKREKVPAVAGLLFAHSRKSTLNELLRVMPTLQFRYLRGGYQKLMTVRDTEMKNFIRAVEGCDDVAYHTTEEVSALSVGKDVRIIGGPLDGVEGKIVNVRGSHKKRIMVSIPNFIAAVVEVPIGELTLL